MLPARPDPELGEACGLAQAWRVIASRYPPIDLFERVSTNPAVWDALIELEQLVNPRARDAVGEIGLVPPERRLAGEAREVVRRFGNRRREPIRGVVDTP
jgi:hypothetical protein